MMEMVASMMVVLVNEKDTFSAFNASWNITASLLNSYPKVCIQRWWLKFFSVKKNCTSHEKLWI